MKIFLIGISDSREQTLSEEVREVIRSHRHFSGGRRHHEIMRPFLPAEHDWIDIIPPIDDQIRSYGRYEDMVVVASCDPIFNGIGQRIMELHPEAEITLFPHFHSLQMLAHAALLPYQDMHVVSLTGRPWRALDEALICGERMIGILTDLRHHTPRTIAERMIAYGYDNYVAYVGEHLGNRVEQRVSRLSIEEMRERNFGYPNNLILLRMRPLERPFGIPDEAFVPLEGRPRMITKSPIRLQSLSLLGLHQAQTLWDVGSCTGSVSIEARLQFPHLAVVAFEIRPEGGVLLETNARRLHAPGIDFVSGDFLEADLSALPTPDAVFIGGHGGRLPEMIRRIYPLLPAGGRIVFNSVSDESRQLFLSSLADVGTGLSEETLMTVDHFNPIHVMQATK